MFKSLFQKSKNNKITYLDSGATSMKLDLVVDAEIEFLTKFNTNTHNEVSENSSIINEVIEKLRVKVKEFLNAKDGNVAFVSGSTFALNQLAFGLIDEIDSKDEIVITSVEHSANLLPWIEITNKTKAKLNYFDLNDNGTIKIENIKNVINKNTKIVSFAHISNTLGYENNVKAIVDEIRRINPKILIYVDCAQSISHTKIDLNDWDVDAIVFSAHKMYGPFGLGILWAKDALLDRLKPLVLGGGNIVNVDKNSYLLSEPPYKFEAGTMNLSSIYSFDKLLSWYKLIDFNSINKYEKELKEYFVTEFKKLNDENIIIYNLDNNQVSILFNVKGVSSQDFAIFLEKKYQIITRAGQHCAQLTKELINSKTTIRATLSIFNTRKDIDKLIEAFKDKNSWTDYIF
ncbi:cysteine desulfurase [Spiroplasma sp. TIUS-1]|uniref:aminotransferase class V-fold PLP-dependent enzyme n=1 Tax=Spiroplasma sp. TIUS-1 TaxID=216963 RepID=UPI001397D1CB|nr:aminotransferase class V-fold PLP-dependent enzyme [Spiroplasma sp. TIUS-1]QHX35798.1 cysteine desulfurase [Spiroplasma sp. TIUS-1]